MNIKLPCFLTISLLLISTPVFAQKEIGLKFTGGQANRMGATLKPTDKAGVPIVAQVNWNILDSSQGTAVALKADDGSKTAATATFTSPNTWSASTDADKGPDFALMDGYLDSADDGAAAVIKVEGVPYASYDVYVYFNTDAPAQHRKATYTIGTRSIDVTAGEAFSGGFIKAEQGSNGNYAVFTALVGSTFTLTGKSGAADGTPRCVFNAIQIVKRQKQ